AVAGFARRLCATLELLALRHHFPAPGGELRIDASDSGFFHWGALLELAADLERRQAALAELPDAAALRRRMLEQIVRHALHPRELQAALMRRRYLEALGADGVFRPFVPGALEKVGGPENEASWLWSFATYDRALNRPFLHVVYFEWDGSALDTASDEFAELVAAAERCAAGRASLLVVSRRLDEQVP